MWKKNNKNKVKTLQLHLTAATTHRVYITLNIHIQAVHCGSFSVSLSFTNMWGTSAVRHVIAEMQMALMTSFISHYKALI